MAEAPKPWRYFNDPWNVMDFIIVAVRKCILCWWKGSSSSIGYLLVIRSSKFLLLLQVGLIDTFLSMGGVDLGGAGNVLMVFRLIRLMRIMKLVKSIPQLRIIISTMIAAMPSVMYISILIFLLLYIYGSSFIMCHIDTTASLACIASKYCSVPAHVFLIQSFTGVLGVFIFGENDVKYFGNLGTVTLFCLRTCPWDIVLRQALITLFRVMTMDHWGEVWLPKRVPHLAAWLCLFNRFCT